MDYFVQNLSVSGLLLIFVTQNKNESDQDILILHRLTHFKIVSTAHAVTFAVPPATISCHSTVIPSTIGAISS
jgi:hypothetical protein